MLHQTFLFLGQLWQLFEVSQILEFFTVPLDLTSALEEKMESDSGIHVIPGMVYSAILEES